MKTTRVMRAKVRELGTLSLPLTAIIASIVAFLIIISVRGQSVRLSNGYDILENLADVGWLSMGVGLSMLVGEFDVSVPAMYGLGGIVAVQFGQHNPFLGIVAAIVVGLATGLIQGGIIAWFSIGSVPVTLGGFIALSGIAFLRTQGNSISFTNIQFVERLSNPVASIFSLRSIITIVGLLIVGMFLRYTRIGPAVRSVGGDRRASRVAGVSVNKVLIGVFIVSAVGSSVAGALSSFSLAFASPSIQFSPVIFAVSAVVIGGISLNGGSGTILGLTLGILALSIIQEGLTVTAFSSDAQSVINGAILLCVAFIAAREKPPEGTPSAAGRLLRAVWRRDDRSRPLPAETA
jgi:ribose transport system permease protein